MHSTYHFNKAFLLTLLGWVGHDVLAVVPLQIHSGLHPWQPCQLVQ